MRELSTKEIQIKLLSILDEVDKFCKDHQITYFLVGGALLGAVREGKLIAWDDDIDLIMPRSDYMHFVSEFKDSSKYRLLESSRIEQYYYPFAKVCDCSTKVIEDIDAFSLKPLDCLGVGIDIFPLDDYPDNGFVAFWKVIRQRALQGLCYKELMHANPKDMSAFKRLILTCYKKLIGLKTKSPRGYINAIESLWSSDSPSSKVIDTWTYEVYSRDWLFPVGSIELEGKMYAAPGNCDMILNTCYGADYMIPRNTQPDGHGHAYEL